MFKMSDNERTDRDSIISLQAIFQQRKDNEGKMRVHVVDPLPFMTHEGYIVARPEYGLPISVAVRDKNNSDSFTIFQIPISKIRILKYEIVVVYINSNPNDEKPINPLSIPDIIIYITRENADQIYEDLKADENPDPDLTEAAKKAAESFKLPEDFIMPSARESDTDYFEKIFWY